MAEHILEIKYNCNSVQVGKEWIEFKHSKVFLFYERVVRILINLNFDKHMCSISFGCDLKIELNFQTKIELEKKT